MKSYRFNLAMLYMNLVLAGYWFASGVFLRSWWPLLGVALSAVNVYWYGKDLSSGAPQLSPVRSSRSNNNGGVK